MEIVGVTRLVNGKETDEFVVGCSEHGYWYKGLPPLTHGCRSCWEAYFFANFARGGANKEQIDNLEAAVRHAAELADKGEWDFKPDFQVNIANDKNN